MMQSMHQMITTQQTVQPAVITPVQVALPTQDSQGVDTPLNNLSQEPNVNQDSASPDSFIHEDVPPPVGVLVHPTTIQSNMLPQASEAIQAVRELKAQFKALKHKYQLQKLGIKQPYPPHWNDVPFLPNTSHNLWFYLMERLLPVNISITLIL